MTIFMYKSIRVFLYRIVSWKGCKPPIYGGIKNTCGEGVDMDPPNIV